MNAGLAEWAKALCSQTAVVRLMRAAGVQSLHQDLLFCFHIFYYLWAWSNMQIYQIV